MNPHAPVPSAPAPIAPAPAPAANYQAAPPAPFIPAPAPAPLAPVAAAPPAPAPAPAPAPMPPAEAPKFFVLVNGQVDQTPKTVEEIRAAGIDLNTVSVARVGDNTWVAGNTIEDAAQPAPQLPPPPGTNPVPRPTPGRLNPAITAPAPGKEIGGSGEVVGDGATEEKEPNEDGFIPGEEVPYDVLVKHLRGKENQNIPNQGVGEGVPLPQRRETRLPS